jgi:hypothetical protein
MKFLNEGYFPSVIISVKNSENGKVENAQDAMQQLATYDNELSRNRSSSDGIISL